MKEKKIVVVSLTPDSEVLKTIVVGEKLQDDYADLGETDDGRSINVYTFEYETIELVIYINCE